MKIYTRTGDEGDTSLYGGERRSKADQRIEAYGQVDELQAALGVLATQVTDPKVQQLLHTIQEDCFVINCELARPVSKVKQGDPVLAERKSSWLEEKIDLYTAELPTLQHFILPGGCPAGAYAHLVRTICRRAERAVIRLSETEAVSVSVRVYLNRLSDLLFTLARFLNFKAGQAEYYLGKS